MKTSLQRIALTGLLATALAGATPPLQAQTNPLWHEQKVKNYLPHMTVPEVRDFLKRSDLVLIPVAAIEQHGLHLPLGTDYLNGVERAKLVAQRADVVVAPVLLAGQSPYHLDFPGTISLSAETIVKVHLEAVQSLLRHGFKRFLILNAHGGNASFPTVDSVTLSSSTASIRRRGASPSIWAKPSPPSAPALPRRPPPFRPKYSTATRGSTKPPRRCT